MKKKAIILRAPTAKKINSLITQGHIPHRLRESYMDLRLGANNLPAYRYVNCYSHACFNLSNEELAQICYDEFDKESSKGFSGLFVPDKKIEHGLMRFVESTGLKVEESKPGAIIKNNQWIVAMYYSNTWIRDYHFLLRENDGTWSSKEGFTQEVNFIENPMTEYRGYEYQKTFCITNPYAPEEKIK